MIDLKDQCRIAEIEGKHHTPNVGGDLDIYSQYMAGYMQYMAGATHTKYRLA
jgi:hypothetical protein